MRTLPPMPYGIDWMQPTVSAIIAAYNADRYVKSAVESVLGQDYPVLEVIVVDDGSAKRLDWVTALAPSRIKYFWKENGGPASARNLGVRQARGELIAFLDADDIWERHKITRQISVLEREPDAAFVATQETVIGPDGAVLSHAMQSFPPAIGRPGSLLDPLFDDNFIGTSTVLMRRAAFEAVGGFDESSELRVGEDYDLWLRIAERYKILIIDEALSRYRVHEPSLTGDPESFIGEQLAIERAIVRHPAFARQAGRRLGNVYFKSGIRFMNLGRVDRARAQLMESIRLWPWRPRAWLYFAASLLSPGGVHTLRKAKRLAGTLMP